MSLAMFGVEVADAAAVGAAERVDVLAGAHRDHVLGRSRRAQVLALPDRRCRPPEDHASPGCRPRGPPSRWAARRERARRRSGRRRCRHLRAGRAPAVGARCGRRRVRARLQVRQVRGGVVGRVEDDRRAHLDERAIAQAVAEAGGVRVRRGKPVAESYVARHDVGVDGAVAVAALEGAARSWPCPRGGCTRRGWCRRIVPPT